MERPSVPDNDSSDSANTETAAISETAEGDDGGSEDDDPIESVIDDTLENMLLSDDDDVPV